MCVFSIWNRLCNTFDIQIKTMNKKGLLVAIFSLSALSLSAQIDSLALEEMNETEKISQLLNAYKNYQFNISDYKIQIFSGGLTNAQEVEKEAKERYQDWPISLDFISPSYRVRLGAFKTRLLAEKNLISVRKIYPSAVLLKPKKIQ